MLFNLAFAKNTISFCLSSNSLNYWLILHIPAAIAQIFNPTAELVILIGIPIKKKKKKKKKKEKQKLKCISNFRS